MAAEVVWAIDLVMFLGTVFLAVYVIRGRPGRLAEQRRQTAEALATVTARPKSAELLAAWRVILEKERIDPDEIDQLTFIGALNRASDEDADALIGAAHVAVNLLNPTLAELIDNRLLRPKDFVRSHRDLHYELLVELSLIEPVIWHQSLIDQLGRWGYRLLALRPVLDQLRAVSPSPMLWRAVRVQIGSKPIVLADSLSAWRRWARKAAYVVHSPTITTRGKISQNRMAAALTVGLLSVGLVLPAPPQVVDW